MIWSIISVMERMSVALSLCSSGGCSFACIYSISFCVCLFLWWNIQGGLCIFCCFLLVDMCCGFCLLLSFLLPCVPPLFLYVLHSGLCQEVYLSGWLCLFCHWDDCLLVDPGGDSGPHCPEMNCVGTLVFIFSCLCCVPCSFCYPPHAFLREAIYFCSCSAVSSCVCMEYASVGRIRAFHSCIRSFSGILF